MVGVTPECRMPPSRVRSVRDWLATASQVRKRNVGDSGGLKRGLQCRLLILRLTAGAGKRRTSATTSIRYAAKTARKSGRGRVECPTVHTLRVESKCMRSPRAAS
jgi:hypothetical protein